MKKVREYVQHSEQEGTERSQQIYRNAVEAILNGIFSEMFFLFSMVIVNLHYKIERERQIGRWDLIIAHPPCTYISNAGARFLYPKGVLNEERLRKGIEATHFFMAFYYADCDKVVIENPVPSSVYMLPKYTQTIQPWQFGHPVQKKTCLWIRGLNELKPTNIVEERQSSKVAGNWFNAGGKDRQKNRAKTFEGIAEAMAEQWG